MSTSFVCIFSITIRSSEFDPYFSNLGLIHSDYGTIVLHMPTARMLPAGSLSFHWSVFSHIYEAQ